jgi:hypothetical protein
MNCFLAKSPSFWSGEKAPIAVAPPINFGSLSEARAAVAASSSLQGETISTLLLTVLLAIGLFFFLRASGKPDYNFYMFVMNRNTLKSINLLNFID